MYIVHCTFVLYILKNTTKHNDKLRQKRHSNAGDLLYSKMCFEKTFRLDEKYAYSTNLLY